VILWSNQQLNQAIKRNQTQREERDGDRELRAGVLRRTGHHEKGPTISNKKQGINERIGEKKE